MHLAESPLWKQRNLSGSERLEEGRCGSAVYLGRLLETESPSYNELQAEEERLRSSLQRFCPGLDSDLFSLFLFPQLFLT